MWKLQRYKASESWVEYLRKDYRKKNKTAETKININQTN